MKLAFFDKNTHLVDFQRHKLFADKHGFNISSTLNILSLFFCKDKINILISDCCQLTSLFKIYFLKILIKKIPIVIIIKIELNRKK